MSGALVRVKESVLEHGTDHRILTPVTYKEGYHGLTAGNGPVITAEPYKCAPEVK